MISVTGCPVCGSNESWGRGSWCPTCGYYPDLMKSSAVKRRVAEAAATPVKEPFNLKQALQPWIMLLGAGVLVVIVFSFVASAMLPETGPERIFFALGQCLLGMLAMGTAQVTTFLYAATKSDKFSPFDVFMKPVEIWKPTFSLLPKAAWRVWSAAWGMTAILCGVFIVGGLRFEALFEDWGVEKKASLNVVQEVVKKAKQEREGADSLEEAMNDFAGSEEEKKEDINKLPSEDCLIIGYVTNAEGEMESVLVASVVRNELTYVGNVPMREVPEAQRETLIERMKHNRRRSPFVKIDIGVVESDKQISWLEPKLMCEVAYTQWNDSHHMKKPRMKRMLADVDAK